MTALEQPTLAKWNILGTNDAYFNTQVGANFSSGTTSTVWWEELGRTTLGVAGDTISVASFAARANLQLIYRVSSTGGTINTRIAFNSDSGANYAWQESTSFAASSNAVSQTIFAPTTAASATSRYGHYEIKNNTAERKLFQGYELDDNAAGAASSVNCKEVFGKWANTSAQITTIALTNVGTGDFAIGSELIVLGHD